MITDMTRSLEMAETLYLDIRSVPGEIGILPEYREVTGTPRGLNGPTWALVEKQGSKGSVGRPPPKAQTELV